MKKTAIVTLVAAAMATATPAFAGVAEELAMMKARIAQLESQLAEQQATIAKQQSTGSSAGGFSDNVSVAGTLEILANHVEESNGNSKSDIAVDTFELEIAAQLNENVAVAATLEYDGDDQERIKLAEAFAEIGNEDSVAKLTVGKTGIPFAVVNDAGWTAPLTDDHFDITEGMAMVSFGGDMVSADLFVFNNNEDTLGSFGFNAGVAVAEGIKLGAGYVSEVTTGLATSEDAWRLNAMAETGPFAFTAEYIQVDGTTDPDILALNAAYNTNLMGEDATIYLGWSEVDDAAANDAERLVLGVERAFGENVSVAAEYVRDEDSAGADTDTVNLVLLTGF